MAKSDSEKAKGASQKWACETETGQFENCECKEGEKDCSCKTKEIREDSQVIISAVSDSSNSQSLKDGLKRYVCGNTLKDAQGENCDSQFYLDSIQQKIAKTLKPVLSSFSRAHNLTRVSWTKRLNFQPSPVINPPRSINQFSCEVRPGKLVIAIPSSIFISCSEPLTQDTDILLGPLTIPPQNVTLLNRFQLKVTLSPNKVMEAVAKAQKNSLEWSIISQGKFAVPVIPKSLDATVIPSTPPPIFAIKPSENQPGGLLKITLTKNLAADVHNVYIGGQHATIQNRNKKVLTVTLPSTVTPIPKGKLPVVINLLSKPEKPLIRDKVFKYTQ